MTIKDVYGVFRNMTINTKTTFACTSIRCIGDIELYRIDDWVGEQLPYRILIKPFTIR